MELPTFSGCLGGVPEKARYIIGKHKNKLFYMDPHYVQSAVNLSSLED